MFLGYIRKKKGITFGLSSSLGHCCDPALAWMARPRKQGSFPDMGKGCFILSFYETALAPTQSSIRCLLNALLLG